MSPSIQPATDFDGAQDDVIALIKRPQIDAFALRLLKKRVDALAGSDACGRFELLSALAARTGDMDEAARLFEAAMNADPGNRVQTVLRHMSLMQTAIQIGRVQEVFEAYYPLLRNTPDAVRDSRNMLCMCGFYQTANRLIEDAERLHMQTAMFDPKAVATLEEAGITDDDLSIVVAHCMEFLRAEHQFPDAARANFIGALEGEPGLLVEFPAAGEPEEIAALEWRMFESLAERSFRAIDCGFLSVGLFAPVEVAPACP